MKTEAYEGWERGDSLPTMRQLEKLADAFLIPLGTFFAESPPDLPDPIPAMRRLPDAVSRPDPALVRQIRIAAGRRQLALDLLAEIDEDAPPFEYTADLGESPTAVAARIRFLLGVTPEAQTSWVDKWAALNAWRDATERLGVLVFQIGLPLEVMRGFALADRPLPVVAINSKDSPFGRIFTLVHELAHVLLGQSTLENGSLGALHDVTEVEEFCNRVAAEVLLPKGLVLADEDVVRLGAEATWSMAMLSRVSRRYKVSDAVLVRRLWSLGRINEPSYRELYRQVSRRVYSESASGGDPYLNVVKQVGLPLLRLAFASAYQDRLTAHGLSKIAGLGVQHLGRLEEQVQGNSLMFETHG